MSIGVMAFNAIRRLSGELEGVKVTPKQAEFLRLVKGSDTTPAQLDSWIAANPDEAQVVFFNPTIVSMLLGNPALQKLVYDSASAAGLAFNSLTWWQEFSKFPANVDILVASDKGLEALWGKHNLLLDVYDKRSTNGLWSRFVALSTSVRARWGAGSSVWGATNGTYAPFPGISGKVIVVRASVSSSAPGNPSDAYRFNSRIRGGPEITSISSAPGGSNVVDTFAAHPIPVGTRTSGTAANGTNFDIYFLPAGAL